MAKRQPNPYFKFQQFTVYHDLCAMKVGTDGVLLGAWVDVSNVKTALDIGTGTGLISLMMAQRNSSLSINAIDIDTGAILQAKININQSPFANNTHIQETALQHLDTETKYDVIVSNPPFFNDSLKSTDKQRNLARHTDSLSAEDLIHHASMLLNDSGKLSLIYPYEYKETLINLASEYKMSISRVTSVLPTPNAAPKRILIELSKQKSKLTETELILEVDRHVYSTEFQELVKDFYLNT